MRHMKPKSINDEFCLYTEGRQDGAPYPLGRLGVSKERHAVSLAKDGLAFVAGIGHSHYAVAHSSLPEHIHPGCMELHYCLNGAIKFEIVGETHTLLPGEVCVTQPDVRHHLVSNAKGHRHYWLLLKLPSANGAAGAFGLPPAEAKELRRRLAAIRRPVFPVDAELKPLFGEVFKALETMPCGTYRTLRLRTAILRILTLLVRDAGRRDASRRIASSIERLVSDIRQKPGQQRTVEEMARATGRSESRFNTEFKRATGFPPAAFIVNCRIQKGRQLLETSSLAISAIARSLGYCSTAHFSAQFKLFCGMTPRECRKTASQAPRI